jgi:hypothetical protein
MQVHKASCIKILILILIEVIHPRVRDIPLQKPDSLTDLWQHKKLNDYKNVSDYLSSKK